jgi:hypothetical protein
VIVRREDEDQRDVGDGRGPIAARWDEDTSEGLQEVCRAAGRRRCAAAVLQNTQGC